MYHVIWTDDIMLYKKRTNPEGRVFVLVILTVYVCLLYMDVGKHTGLVCECLPHDYFCLSPMSCVTQSPRIESPAA